MLPSGSGYCGFLKFHVQSVMGLWACALLLDVATPKNSHRSKSHGHKFGWQLTQPLAPAEMVRIQWICTDQEATPSANTDWEWEDVLPEWEAARAWEAVRETTCEQSPLHATPSWILLPACFISSKEKFNSNWDTYCLSHFSLHTTMYYMMVYLGKSRCSCQRLSVLKPHVMTLLAGDTPVFCSKPLLPNTAVWWSWNTARSNWLHKEL